MLFRKKDNASGVKEKATLDAVRAKRRGSDVESEKIPTKNVSERHKTQQSVTITAGTASGKANVAVLIRPRITEKATDLSGRSVYAFEVLKGATKKEIEKAFFSLYKTKPVKVAILATPAKVVFRRGKWGRVAGGKKAYVFLKKGETIELV